MLVAIIAAIPGVVAAILSFFAHKGINEVHLSVNSRLDELLAVTRKSSHAEGLAEGRSEKK